ncbi:MAG: DUF2065 family protein [Deltaproteobacteria bacterium]
MRLLFIVLGALLLLEGIPYLVFPSRARQWALSVEAIPVKKLRYLGLAAVAAGAFILAMVVFL